MSTIKKLASDTVLYGLSSIVGRLLNWLLVFVHTRIFEQPRLLADNGQLYTYIIPLNILFTFGMETAFFRFGTKQENQAHAFSQIASFLLAWAGGLSFFLALFADPIITWLGFPGKGHLIQWLSVVLWLDTLAALAFVRLRAQQRAKRFVAIKLLNIFLTIALQVFFFLGCDLILKGVHSPEWAPLARYFYNPDIGPDYIIIVNLIASAVTLLFLFPQFKDYRWQFQWSQFQPILRYAYPLVWMGLAGAINLTADRILFLKLIPADFYPGSTPEDAFSIYAQVYKLSIFMALVVQAYRYAADPLFFSKMGDKNSPSLIALSTQWFTIACVIIWVGVSLNLDWISLFLGASYRIGTPVVPWLLLANLFIGVYGNMSIWLKLTDHTKTGTWITLAGMTVAILGNVILIPKFGYMGCAWTACLSSLTMVGLCYLLGQRVLPIPYALTRLLGYLILGGGIIYGSTFLSFTSLPISAVVHITVLLVFSGLLVIFEKKRQSHAPF
jgi:O-antigen/teichoic acid export membrane protein